jgi:hypothetical protein
LEKTFIAILIFEQSLPKGIPVRKIPRIGQNFVRHFFIFMVGLT